MEKFSDLGDSARLLRLTGLAKVNGVARLAENELLLMDKIVIFARHREVIDKLKEKLSAFNPVIFRGGMTPPEKEKAKHFFITDPFCRVFIGNIQAAGTGVDGLQKVSNTAIFAELSWVPGEMEQCVRRLKRMGSIGGTVRALVTHATGTLESAILGSHAYKIPVIKRLMGGGDEWNDLDGLI